MEKTKRSSAITAEQMGIDLIGDYGPKRSAAEYVMKHFDQHPLYKRYYCDDKGNVYHITKTYTKAIKLTVKATTCGEEDEYAYPIVCVYGADKKPYAILLHRFCTECRYKMLITDEDYKSHKIVIHHKNEDKFDASKENLEIVDSRTHNLYHHKGRKYKKHDIHR